MELDWKTVGGVDGNEQVHTVHGFQRVTFLSNIGSCISMSTLSRRWQGWHLSVRSMSACGCHEVAHHRHMFSLHLRAAKPDPDGTPDLTA